MNGYAAVHEVVTRAPHRPAGPTARDRIGTVHAAETDDSGLRAGPVTLCGRSTAAMPAAPGDRPGEPGDAWWPQISGIRICAACDRET
ncbi:hypothetical protein [Streptomyces erythrochromogenes]|uniref:hypothetical protein n=1 Tax=Streptomyces erythrochromogenes TaxID=285574 RepID=UPI003702A6D4